MLIQRTSHFPASTVSLAFADPTREVVRQRSYRTPSACCTPTIAGVGRGIGLGPLARLVAATCASALLLLTPLRAAGPAGLEIGQAKTAPAEEDAEKTLPPAFPMEEFLDRLMIAESGGRLRRKNPRSTALGPFQFIESPLFFSRSACV